MNPKFQVAPTFHDTHFTTALHQKNLQTKHFCLKRRTLKAVEVKISLFVKNKQQ